MVSRTVSFAFGTNSNARRPATTGSSRPNRADLEDAWRARVEDRRAAYESSAAHYRQMLNATPEAHSPETSGSAVAEAQAATAQAREEYRRVLRIFTALMLHGRVPDESVMGEASGV